MTGATAKRGQPGYVHPKRDLAREARVIEARLAGVGVTEISRKEGVGRGYVMTVLKASGKTFPEAKRGPKAAPKVARPAPAKPRPMVIRKVVDPWAPRPGVDPVPLLAVRSGCRWPIAGTAGAGGLVCGAAASDGSYCRFHRALSLSTTGRAGDPHSSCTGARRVA